MDAQTSHNVEIDAKVKQVVANIRNLPTPPIVFTQIQKVINRETASAADVSKILAEDPSMSAKVLKMTNSAFYGLPREIDSVQQAVMIIGFEAVKNLVLSASVLEMFKGNKIDSDFQERFWRHSLATAFGSRLIARKVKSRGAFDVEAAFSAGLLHDIGKLVIACFLPDEFKEIAEEVKRTPNTEDKDIEMAVLGYSHEQVGAALAVSWNLSSTMIDAIAFHHYPEKSGVEHSLSYAIYFANYLAKEAFAFDYEERQIEKPDPKIMAYLDVTDDLFGSFQETLLEEYTNAETFVSIAGV